MGLSADRFRVNPPAMSYSARFVGFFFAFVTVWHSAFLPHSLEDTLNWILFKIKSCHFPTHFVDIQLD